LCCYRTAYAVVNLARFKIRLKPQIDRLRWIVLTKPTAPFGSLSINGPAKVHLDGANLVAAERENFGVSSPAATSLRRFVGHNHFVTGLNDPKEVELLALPCTWPAAVEITHAIQSDVERAGECELVGEDALDQAAIASREGVIYVSYDFRSGQRVVLLGVTHVKQRRPPKKSFGGRRSPLRRQVQSNIWYLRSDARRDWSASLPLPTVTALSSAV
jgi:hypothetical protein